MSASILHDTSNTDLPSHFVQQCTPHRNIKWHWKSLEHKKLWKSAGNQAVGASLSTAGCRHWCKLNNILHQVYIWCKVGVNWTFYTKFTYGVKLV